MRGPQAPDRARGAELDRLQLGVALGAPAVAGRDRFGDLGTAELVPHVLVAHEVASRVAHVRARPLEPAQLAPEVIRACGSHCQISMRAAAALHDRRNHRSESRVKPPCSRVVRR
jgi:hypothetical protein